MLAIKNTAENSLRHSKSVKDLTTLDTFSLQPILNEGTSRTSVHAQPQTEQKSAAKTTDAANTNTPPERATIATQEEGYFFADLSPRSPSYSHVENFLRKQTIAKSGQTR